MIFFHISTLKRLFSFRYSQSPVIHLIVLVSLFIYTKEMRRRKTRLILYHISNVFLFRLLKRATSVKGIRALKGYLFFKNTH